MSWLFSRALVAEFSAAICWMENRLRRRMGALRRWRTCRPTERDGVLPRLSRFGMTFEPLTDDLGEAVSTWFLGASPARTSASPVKGQEINERRSGMWGHMARVIGEVRPRFAFVENSPALLTRGL